MPLLAFYALLVCYRVIFTFTCTLNLYLRDLCDDVPERSVVARGADTNPPQNRVGPCDVSKWHKSLFVLR